jgi:hypothetical protein
MGSRLTRPCGPLTQGREEVIPGVTAITGGGRSPDRQLTVVRGESGDVLLASDAVHQRMCAAYGVLRGFARAGAVVVPGHAADVGERFRDPRRREP